MKKIGIIVLFISLVITVFGKNRDYDQVFDEFDFILTYSYVDNEEYRKAVAKRPGLAQKQFQYPHHCS